MTKSTWKLKSSTIPNTPEDIIDIVLATRNITNIQEFLDPPHPLEFAKKDPELKKLIETKITKAVDRIKNAISHNIPIIIHGDYDVDGQTSTAILWRTIYQDLNYTNVFPFIPSRFDEGYGLSDASIMTIKTMLSEKGFSSLLDNQTDRDNRPLLITVDCGITAVEETQEVKKQGFEIIITDHHKPAEKLPEPDILVWSDKPTGAGVAWLLSAILLESIGQKPKYLELACMGTICDLMPVIGINRSIVKYGLIDANKLENPGITALKESASINNPIDTYEVGWVLGPRLNAAGRLETAMDSLRLLSTNSKNQAVQLAASLNEINKTRQDKTFSDYLNAAKPYENVNEDNLPNFIVSASRDYHDGIIGLIASKLKQNFNRPTLAIAIEGDTAKGSGRSIEGISIIDELKKIEKIHPDLFLKIGGHDLACGFNIKTENIEILKELLNKIEIPKEIFKKMIEIDLEIKPEFATMQTYNLINKLKPFGVSNNEPVLLIKNLKVLSVDFFGKTSTHVKVIMLDQSNNKYTGIAFGAQQKFADIFPNHVVDVVFNLTNNRFNNRDSLELKVKDIKLNQKDN